MDRAGSISKATSLRRTTPVGWANGTGKPDVRTIFTDILQLATGRLAPASPPCGIRVQQYPELVHSCVPLLCQMRLPPSLFRYGSHPRVYRSAAEALGDKLQAIQAEMKVNLQQAQERYKKQDDRHTRPAPAIAVGDKVWLNRRNVRTTRPSRKLDVKRTVQGIGSGWRRGIGIQVGASGSDSGPPRTTQSFMYHGWSPIERVRCQGGRKSPVEVQGELEYEVAGILDLKIERRRLKYLVDWVNCGPKLGESSRKRVKGSETFIESKLQERV
jgi:hypothetical protein